MASRLEVLFEDSDLIVCVKPAGVPSQPDISGSQDMQSMVSEYISKGSVPKSAGLVHRLDRETGGVMVFGKSAKATARLNTIIQDKNAVTKEYLAVISGIPQNLQGRLDDWLVLNRAAAKASVVSSKQDGAKEASLLYRVIASENNHSLVHIRLLTGRTHQIRVQFGSRAHSVCGDGKYGSRERGPMALWAYRLSFKHPIKDINIDCCAKPDLTCFFTSEMLSHMVSDAMNWDLLVKD